MLIFAFYLYVPYINIVPVELKIISFVNIYHLHFRSHRHLLKNGREDERLLESIGQFMMEIASRYMEPEHKPDGEDDQETMKKRVEAVWRYFSELSRFLKHRVFKAACF